MWFSTSNGHIELNITKKQAAIGSHAGQCDSDINYLMQLPKIKRQLNKIPVDLLASELEEYGAWNDVELSNHAENLQRILWIACGDILEGHL